MITIVYCNGNTKNNGFQISNYPAEKQLYQMNAEIMSILRNLIQRLMQYERCVHKLSLSFCLGIYIAFSPFVGFHTAMVFLFAWLFALNFTVMLSVSMTVNNPWTMVPVYGAGHWVGDWLLSWFGADHYEWNPSWIQSINAWAHATIGLTGFSFWAFMIGGNLLGISLSVLAYPMIKKLLSQIKEKSSKKVRAAVNKSKAIAYSFASKAKPALKAIKTRVRRKKEA